MHKPPVLIVNSYAGSLTIAAHDEGHPVVASMEDHAFGIDSQKLNFPSLDYRPYLQDWPIDLDLADKMVIAHPPCSGFSPQNSSKDPKVRGWLSNAFNCTQRLLDYSMERRAECIAVESVPGAMKGGAHVHDFYAKAYDYDLYRVMQNAASYGVPQWRKRFWAIFVKRKPGRPHQFTFKLRHTIKYLQDVLSPECVDEQHVPWHDKNWKRQLAHCADLGIGEERFRDILKCPDDEPHINVILLLAAQLGIPKSHGWPPWGRMLHDHVMGGNFLSGAIHVLNPRSFAPTLLGTAWWYYQGKMLGYADYKKIMGFPGDYRIHKPFQTLTLLSKGVCPPVARWVLREMTANVFGQPRGAEREAADDVFDELDLRQEVTINPGELAELETPRKYHIQPKEVN